MVEHAGAAVVEVEALGCVRSCGVVGVPYLIPEERSVTIDGTQTAVSSTTSKAKYPIKSCLNLHVADSGNSIPTNMQVRSPRQSLISLLSVVQLQLVNEQGLNVVVSPRVVLL
jgi:hypothetical protein